MYEYLCRVHIVPCLDHIQLQKLTPRDLDAFYAERLRSPRADGKPGTISASTVRHLHDVIHIALGRAVKWQLIHRNVADAATAPAVPKRKMAVWTPEETVTFLGGLREDRLYAAFLLALQAGLRRGEILGSTWGLTGGPEGNRTHDLLNAIPGRGKAPKELQAEAHFPLLKSPRNSVSSAILDFRRDLYSSLLLRQYYRDNIFDISKESLPGNVDKRAFAAPQSKSHD